MQGTRNCKGKHKIPKSVHHSLGKPSLISFKLAPFLDIY